MFTLYSILLFIDIQQSNVGAMVFFEIISIFVCLWSQALPLVPLNISQRKQFNITTYVRCFSCRRTVSKFLERCL